ncbi:hypothetical protein ACWGBH_03490 [Streptomyces massasporeus]
MTDRRSQRRKMKGAASSDRPRFGPWANGEPGWTICRTHDFGIAPGSACLRCRLTA